jgi:hypothetical protein
MEKLVLDYTHCSEPECWNHDIPFEYESKEKFIFDVIKNPMLLNQVIECVYEWHLEDKVENELLDNIDQYIFTLDEWFERNKRNITK